MAAGDHKFFLRHDESFVQMTLDGGWVPHRLGSLPINRTMPILPSSGERTDPNFSILKPFNDANADDIPLRGSPADLNFDAKKLSINATAAELGPAGGLKQVTVVWNTNLGDIGVSMAGQ